MVVFDDCVSGGCLFIVMVSLVGWIEIDFDIGVCLWVNYSLFCEGVLSNYDYCFMN